MGHLLAAGCSWTDANFKSGIEPDYDCSFPKWPDLLGDSLSIDKVVNVGESGASNNYIFEKCYDQILKQKPDLVCILLTSWHRHTMYNLHFNLFWLLITDYMHSHPDTTIEHTAVHNEWVEKWLMDNHVPRLMANYIWQNGLTVECIINETLRNIFLFQSFCKQNDIKFLIAQGIYPVSCDDTISDPYFKSVTSSTAFDPNLRKQLSYPRAVIKSEYSPEINEKNVVGWPFFENIGGSSATTKFVNTSYQDCVVSKRDGHPNALGHKIIANMFTEGYNNAYNN